MNRPDEFCKRVQRFHVFHIHNIHNIHTYTYMHTDRAALYEASALKDAELFYIAGGFDNKKVPPGLDDAMRNGHLLNLLRVFVRGNYMCFCLSLRRSHASWKRKPFWATRVRLVQRHYSPVRCRRRCKAGHGRNQCRAINCPDDQRMRLGVCHR